MIALVRSDFDPEEQYRQAMAASWRQIEDLGAALEEATDPTDVVTYSQQLAQALTDRYQMELQHVENLKKALDEAQQVYDRMFDEAVNRYSNITAAMGGISGNYQPAIDFVFWQGSQILGQGLDNLTPQDYEDLTQLIGQWLQLQEAQIKADPANTTQYWTGKDYTNDLEILRTQLKVIRQWDALADRIQGTIDNLRGGQANPGGIINRLAYARGRIADVQSLYDAATGADRVKYAGELADLYSMLQSIGAEGFGFASPEYREIYEESLAGLEGLQDEALTWAEQQTRLQEDLVRLQEEANANQLKLVTDTSAMDAKLAAAQAQALEWYDWVKQYGTDAWGKSLYEKNEEIRALEAQYGAAVTSLEVSQGWTVTVLDDVRDYLGTTQQWYLANTASFSLSAAENLRELVSIMGGAPHDTIAVPIGYNPTGYAPTPIGSGVVTQAAPVVNLTINTRATAPEAVARIAVKEIQRGLEYGGAIRQTTQRLAGVR